MKRINSLAVSLAAVAAVGSVAACSSSGGSGASSLPPASAPATSTPTSTSAPAPATVTSTTTVSPSASAASSSRTGGQCAESQLRASVKPYNVAGLPNHVVRLTFLNKSGTSCTLTGYPGAAIEDGSGKQVQQAARTAGGPIGGTIERPGTVTLKAGASAYAYLEGTSTREQGAAQAGCEGARYPRILVTPPNTDTAVPFTIGWPQCFSFRIHPVRVD